MDMLAYAYLSADKIKRLIPDEFTVRRVEAIGWRPMFRLKSIVNQLKKEEIEVSDFHLRTGTESRSGIIDKFKILLLQQLIHSAKTVSIAFPDTAILLHSPEAAKQSVFRSIIRYKPAFLWIENHKQGLQGVLEAKRLVHLYRANGVKSAIMYDGGHRIGPKNLLSRKEFRLQWDLMLADKTDPDIWGEHIPICTIRDDGYPMDFISFSMWKDYAHQSSPNLRLRVVENQQAGHLFYVSQRATRKIVHRNAAYYSRLQLANVVDFS